MPEEIDVATYATKNVKIYFRMRAQVDVRRCVRIYFRKLVKQVKIHVRICARLHVTVKNHARTFSMNIYVLIWTWTCFFYETDTRTCKFTNNVGNLILNDGLYYPCMVIFGMVYHWAYQISTNLSEYLSVYLLHCIC